MKLELVGYYWDGKISWIIYKKPDGLTIMKKNNL
jgi:hypothetical protein